MPRKLTKEEFINREPNILNGEYEFIGEYKDTHTKTLFKHNTCGYEYMVVPSQFHGGRRCPRCGGTKKLTKDEFCRREEDIVSGEYQILGKYINTTTKTLFKHTSCGYEWNITPDNFHQGTRCPKCSGHMILIKKTFCQREKDIVSGEYEMVGEYINTFTRTLFRHNVCGCEWETMPNTFHQGSRCPKCAGNIKLTKEELCEREEDIVSGEYSMLGEYVNNSTNTLFRHNVCGFEWMLRPNNFSKGKRCPKCAHRKIADNQRLDKISFCEREGDIRSGEYEMLGKYISSQTKTLFRHNICGYEWEIAPESFHQNHRCPRCRRVERLTKESFCVREEDIKSGEYSMLGEYVNTNAKTLFKHNQCGYKWETKPNKFQQGSRCPRCNQPRGERIISRLLEGLDVVFESQKRFSTCKYKHPLPFDFCVNNSFLIEYDGEQHFKTVDYFGGDEGFKLRQLRDNIKTQWAKDNGIPLVRIPYTEFDNIEQIIKDNIEKYSIKKVG
jgi:predicted Zn-ribbon and HTH transcriptional regulator